MPADLVLSATPIDLTRLMKLNKPIVRVRYELEEVETAIGPAVTLEQLLGGIVDKARADGSKAAAGR
jgi:predicted GTPase